MCNSRGASSIRNRLVHEHAATAVISEAIDINPQCPHLERLPAQPGQIICLVALWLLLPILYTSILSAVWLLLTCKVRLVHFCLCLSQVFVHSIWDSAWWEALPHSFRCHDAYYQRVSWITGWNYNWICFRDCGVGDHGPKGIAEFVKQHTCVARCSKLGLEALSSDDNKS
jgi:hypothetical protein